MVKSLSQKYRQVLSGERLVFLNFSASTLIRTVILAVAGILIMAWISPEEIGLYNSYSIVIAYVFVLQLGVFNGLNRQAPFLLGQGDKEKVLQLVASALGLAKLLSYGSLLIGVGCLAGIHFFVSPLESTQIKMALAVILLTAINFYQNYLSVTYRSSQHFATLAKINHASSLLILCSLLLVYLWGYNGLILYYLFNNLNYLILTHLYRPYKIGSSFSMATLKELVMVGLPIFVFSYIQQISKTLNRVVLVYFATTFTVGLFSPATAAFAAMAFLPSTIAQFAYPKFSYLYGKHKDTKVFLPYVNKIYLASTALLIPSLLIVWKLLPPLLHHFLPEYVAGTFAAQLLVICGVIDITTIAVNIFYSIGNKRGVAVYTVSRFIAMLSFPLLGLLYWDPLFAVAIGTLCATIFAAVLSYYLLIKSLKR